MTLPISAATHGMPTNLVLFLMFHWSGNSFLILPTA